MELESEISELSGTVRNLPVVINPQVVRNSKFKTPEVRKIANEETHMETKKSTKTNGTPATPLKQKALQEMKQLLAQVKESMDHDFRGCLSFTQDENSEELGLAEKESQRNSENK